MGRARLQRAAVDPDAGRRPLRGDGGAGGAGGRHPFVLPSAAGDLTIRLVGRKSTRVDGVRSRARSFRDVAGGRALAPAPLMAMDAQPRTLDLPALAPRPRA